MFVFGFDPIRASASRPETGTHPSNRSGLNGESESIAQLRAAEGLFSCLLHLFHMPPLSAKSDKFFNPRDTEAPNMRGPRIAVARATL
jgi:hypothetical protein